MFVSFPLIWRDWIDLPSSSLCCYFFNPPTSSCTSWHFHSTLFFLLIPCKLMVIDKSICNFHWLENRIYSIPIMSFTFFATYFLVLVGRKGPFTLPASSISCLKCKHESLLSDLITALVFPWVLVTFYERWCLMPIPSMKPCRRTEHGHVAGWMMQPCVVESSSWIKYWCFYWIQRWSAFIFFSVIKHFSLNLWPVFGIWTVWWKIDEIGAFCDDLNSP